MLSNVPSLLLLAGVACGTPVSRDASRRDSRGTCQFSCDPGGRPVMVRLKERLPVDLPARCSVTTRLPSIRPSVQLARPSPVAVSISNPSGTSSARRNTPERVIVTVRSVDTTSRSSPRETSCQDSARSSGATAATLTFAMTSPDP